MSARRPGLASRTAIVTTAVALLAVIVSGVVSVGLVRSTAEAQARRALARQATLVAELVDASPTGRPLGAARILALLGSQQIGVLRVSPEGRVVERVGGQLLRPRLAAADLPAGDAQRLAAGQPVSHVGRLAGSRVFVEGRPLQAGGGLALVQPASAAGEVTGPVRRRTLLALLAGLVGAALAGVLLSRWLAGPLVAAASAAHRMARGDRGVRVTPEGPAEVAEVAESLNALAGALELSEGRQREFLLSVSHELRTPLTAIRGFAEAVADGVTESPAEAGRTIVTEADRLDRLVSDLLDLARLGADGFRIDARSCDLGAMVEDAAVVWRQRCAADGLELRVEVPTEPVLALVDPVRLRQVVDGLAENALRVTPSGRPIVFGVRAGPVLEVRDGGPGLTDDDCRVAFERSALYDRYRGVRRVGTGVGLALVAGLVTRMGGSCHAGRAPEGGACFTFELPPG